MRTVRPAISILQQLLEMTNQLDDTNYAQALDVFSGSSIGEHKRHIIEFYQCLENVQDGVVSYDSRRRNSTLETSIEELT